MIGKPTGYVKRGPGVGKKLERHFKYLQHRAPEEGEGSHRDLFDATGRAVSRYDARERILGPGGAVAYHKMILSPSAGERVEDWRDWTRRAMDDLGEHKGMALTWVAAFHDAEGHPHVHVVVAGSGVRAGGRAQALVLRIPDYQYLTERAAYHAERNVAREIATVAEQVVAHARLDARDILDLSREHTRARELERGAR